MFTPAMCGLTAAVVAFAIAVVLIPRSPSTVPAGTGR
jgi:hypothetical protein